MTKHLSDQICFLSCYIHFNQKKLLEIEILTKEIELRNKKIETLQRALKDVSK